MTVALEVCHFICLAKVAKLLYFIAIPPQNSYNTLTVNRMNNYTFQIINYKLLALSLCQFLKIVDRK
jgi:hypothetical protein